MKMLLISCVAGVLSNVGLAQAPDLSGNACRGVNAAGDEISLPCAPAVNPHDMACVTSEGVIVPCPQTAADTCFPGQGTESEQRSQPACGDRGAEGHAPGEVTIIRGTPLPPKHIGDSLECSYYPDINGSWHCK